MQMGNQAHHPDEPEPFSLAEVNRKLAALGREAE